MKIDSTSLDGVFILTPSVHGDNRGYFFESYQKERFFENHIKCTFVQDNISRSCKGTLRGLHYQLKQPQAKLLSVINGEIYDVAVDIRLNSPTFGKYFGVFLSDENHKQIFIPEGFAHGFYVLSERADILYKCSNYYSPNDEYGIIWNDNDIDIKWPLNVETPLLSEKDNMNKKLKSIDANLLF